jgi:hypothetical protein
VEFRHYYSIRGRKAWLIHWIAGRRIARESQATLNAMKQAIENRASELLAQRSDSAEPGAAADGGGM